MRSIFLCDRATVPFEVYSKETVAALAARADLDPTVYDKAALLADPARFAAVEYVFSTWGMPALTAEEIRTLLPQLKAVFYAAGSVQYFARPFLECGVAVFSAWRANAVPVAEFTVAQIVLANKGYYRATSLMYGGDVAAARQAANAYHGNYDEWVGIIGAGMIGRHVIRMLKNYNLHVKVFDPFLSDAAAAELGVQKTDLPDLFATCRVISNHLADNPQTRGMLNAALFDRFLPNATFINTGRGAQVVEEDLVSTLILRPDVTALLDVTDPEPPLPDHPFYSLPNCFLTPHIAGSKGQEVHRMAEYMATEFENFIGGAPSDCRVTAEMLATMA